MKEYRDRELGALLAQGDETPPWEPGFEDRVWRRIDAADALGTARPQEPPTNRHRRLLAVTAAAVVGAVVVVLVLLFGVPGTGHEIGPAPVDAVVVSARMAAAMSSYRTLEATVTDRVGGKVVDRYALLTDASGDFALHYQQAAHPKGGSVPLSWTYNARRHVELDTYVEPDGRLTSYEWDQTAPYQGDGVASDAPLYEPGWAWFVRAALVDGDPVVTVTNTQFDGRSAWKVTLPHAKRFSWFAGMTFVVDAKSGFLVQWTWPPNAIAGSGSTSSLTNLRVDEPLAKDAFSTAVPQGARLESVERNSYYCTLAQVSRRVGFRPFLPTWVPQGYRLTDVATDPRYADDFPDWAGPDPGTHDRHTEEFLCYRHGADSFTVHVVAIGRTPRRQIIAWYRQQLALMPVCRIGRVASGTFAGCLAQTWFDFNGANLIVMGSKYVVFLSGSLTRAELYSVADSLGLAAT